MPRVLTGYAVLDLETTTTNYMKRTASPFTADNWVVAGAYKAATGDVVGSYWGEDKRGSEGWLAALLEAHWPKLLVGFNIKFDVLHATRSDMDYAAYKAWVVAGGQLWDCQLEEYLLLGQVPEAQMLSLDEVAPRYGGELKIDEVKALWKAGVNTHEIPRQLLMDYLVGRDGKGGDILNTEAIFLGQLKAARADKQLKSATLNQGSLVCSTEMERNGLFVNVSLANELAEKLREQSASLTASLTTYLPTDLPFEFNWRSRVHLSALIFGGPIPYKERCHQMDESGQPAYATKEETHVLLENGLTMECLWWEHMQACPDGSAIEPLRYSGGQRAGMPKTKKVKVSDTSKPKLKWEDFSYQMKGFTKPRKEWASDTPGVYSTKAEVIEELGGSGIPFLEDFAKLQSIQKDLGTYYITHEYNEDGTIAKSKGMLTLVGPDGIVHHKLNHTSTVTGRFSANDPNTQNLPKESTSEVKKVFESRFGTAGSIISSDFKTLEIYCQAMLAKDKRLIQDLRDGLDMHCARLATAEDKPYEDVLRWSKGPNAIHEWEVKRTDIKVFSFQRAYGAGAAKISAHLKKPKELVESWIEADEKRYPGIKAYNDKLSMVVNGSRVPTARFVTHPTAKVQLQLGRGWTRTFDGKKYVFTETPSPDFMVKRGQLQGFSPTELKNYPVQGLGGEWMKAAMWLAVRAFFHFDNFGGKAFLINTVHDALYVDAHESVRRKAGVVLHACMLAASDLIEYHFSTTVPVPVPSDTSYGSSMYEENNFEDGDAFDASAERVRTWLRKTYMAGYTPSYA